MRSEFGRLVALAVVAFGAWSVFAGAAEDFDAAVKAGRPLSAEAAYLKLVKGGAQTAPIRHYLAADVAAQLGKETLRKDRLMLFVRQEKGWTPQVEQALWFLVSNGGEVEHFVRLSANSPVTEVLWRTGIDMLGTLLEANRPSELLRLADVLMAKFQEIDRRGTVLYYVRENSQRMGEGYPEGDLVNLILKYPGLTRFDNFWSIVWHGNHRKAFSADFLVRYAIKHGENIPDGYLSEQIRALDSDAMEKLTDAEKIRERDDRAENLRKIKKLCFDGRHWYSSFYYMRVAAARLPQLFFKTVETNGYVAGAAKLYRDVLTALPPDARTSPHWRGQIAWTRDDLVNRGRLNAQEIAQIVDLDPSLCDTTVLLTRSPLGDIRKEAETKKSTEPIVRLAKKYPKQADAIYRNTFRYFANEKDGAGDAATVRRIFLDAVSRNWEFDFGWTIGPLLDGCRSMSASAKVELLKSGYTISGYNNAWKEFKRRVTENKDEKSFYADPVVKAFAATIREDALPGDAMLRVAALTTRAKKTDDLHALVGDIRKSYPSKYGESPSARDNDIVARFFQRYWEFSYNAKPEDSAKFAEFAIEKLSKAGPDRSWIAHCANRAAKADLSLGMARAFAALDDTHDALADVAAPKDSEKPVDGIDMRKMSAGRAYGYLSRNWGNIKAPARYQLMKDFFASRPMESNAVDAINWCVRTVADSSLTEKGEVNKALLDVFPLEKIEDFVYAKPYSPYVNRDTFHNLLVIAYRLGRQADAIKRYSAWAEKREPRDRMQDYLFLLTRQIYMPKTEKRDAYYEVIVDGAAFAELVKGPIRTAVSAIPTRQAGAMNFNDGWFWDRLRWLVETSSKAEPKDEATIQAVKAWREKATELILAGARNSEGCMAEANGWNDLLAAALQSKDAVRAARAARKAGAGVDAGRIGWEAPKANIEAFKACGFNESLYLYVDAVPSSAQEGLVALAAKERAALASSLPGVYPVAETDPAYPLYVAADELAKKNPERAWQILSETKNQPVFEREILKLPPDFAIWGVEQLRLARGAKDALLLKARQIATAVIAQETKVAPEIVAAMMLSRAEGYRDQQNFEAAKLEYQSVRDNPTYHATKYGKKAMFRAVDLQIASGNSQGVEATLEYWLSQNDREIQAEAHYFMARIAYDRKDYDACIGQLRQVFAIDFTHTEGRFLQGEWKLATNSEVDDTEVLVGKLGDRNLIKPGNQFTITVQDSNLSVAGGGASIPVVVRTEPGKDCELVNLYPSSRDPSTFKGLVEVVLAKANPSNRVLEVRGDDTVTYVIDPAFLKERGLKANEPKVLRVIDDAKLAVGAGAPQTETKKTERNLAEILDEDRPSDVGQDRKLRPGNPLHIVVRDQDCSHGGEGESVRVTVETSSGDRLEDFELKETKPYSGVFRGKVETALPPPRAFASDTAAGFEPGDVINEKKTAGWKSLSDGQPGKWFEVDTMGSHLFSEITLASPNAADVKTVKLVGRMGSRVLSLGRMPAGVDEMKLGLHRQQQYDRTTKRSLEALRAFCETDRADRPRLSDKVSFRVLQKHNYEPQSAFWRGPFCVPAGVDSFRLRIVQKSPKKDALRGLWVSLAIDGDEVFSGQGCRLQDMLIAPDVTPGCHQFEFAVLGGFLDDEFDLLWEPAGSAAKAFPYEWFSTEKNPALKDFVRDLAEIVKTPEGFKATFAKPVRLRSFRWEFADVKSPDIAVTRIAAKDAKGETVLPVPSDFSDARSNQTLEVAPGDKITVVYEDERTTSGEKKMVQREIESSFNNATVRFIFEDTDKRNLVHDYDAFRFQPGDSLILAVKDADCDVSDKPDVVEVEIRNAAGKTYRKKLVEYWPKWLPWRNESDETMHSGIFMGVLRTCAEGNTNAADKVLRVAPDDQLTVTYDDRENTDPGVPCTRTARIFAARPATPSMTLFDVRKTLEVDNSADGRIRLERIRRRPGNENVQHVYRDVLVAEPMSAEAMKTTNAIPVNVGAGAIPVRVNDRSRARHAGSKVVISAVAHSELEKAAAENREPESIDMPLTLGGALAPIRVVKGSESVKEAQNAGTFSGLVRLSLGPIDPNVEVPEDAPPVLCVTGSDLVDLTVLDEQNNPVARRTVRLVADATLGLTDSSFTGERTSAHVGESFFVMVDDADRDATEEPDRIEAEVTSSKTGVKRKMFLTETMPHSGVFTGRLRPVMFAPGETIPSVATGGVASANEILTEERFAVGYGDKVIFRYRDALTLPGTPARTLSATGTVFRGANGDVRLYSKRFTDRDTAVLVQFRLAECLFEQAKEHRKLKQPEKSAAAIAQGKLILEEALKNYPDSAHVVQGEFLLANLYQELATEKKDAGDEEGAIPLYQEALARFSQILGTWPDGEYAARSQYHKALCLEMLKDYGRASEEYVKMTYLYPESELVGEATIRLATYYYTKEKRFDIAGHIYRNFQQRFPQHEKAARSLFMAGSCYIKQAETLTAEIEKLKDEKKPVNYGMHARVGEFYKESLRTFDRLVEAYPEGATKLKAQALYWAGDVCVRQKDWARAYQYLKRTIFEFPETEWARRARGLLLQEGYFFKDFD